MISLVAFMRSRGCFHRLTFHYKSLSVRLLKCQQEVCVLKRNLSNMAADIKILLAKPTDYDRILDFLRIHFYPEEPMTMGSEPKQQDPEDEKFTMSNLNHDTCLIALQSVSSENNISDGNNNEVLVGAAMAGPKYSDHANRLFKEAALIGPTKWGHNVHFLAQAERDANVFERFEVEKALHVHCLAVDSQVRGQALGYRLLKDLMDLGRRQGYPLITADCTSVYSARICKKLDMACVNCMAYADYLDENGNVVFHPPAPHTCCETYAKRL